jgi:hypothetical protein
MEVLLLVASAGQLIVAAMPIRIAHRVPGHQFSALKFNFQVRSGK